MTTLTDDVARLLATYGSADADLAALLCDDHDPAAIAFTFIEGDLTARDLTYGELHELSARFATGLAEMGVGRGDRVGVLMSKRLELVVALLGLWRLGAVHVPLFTAFATPAIAMRVEAAQARVVITETDQREKLDSIEGITVIETGEGFDALVREHEPMAASVAVGGDGVMIQLFTSGTTGKPKGVPVPVSALASFVAYMTYGLDVSEDDVFWNAADPGWAYGLYYAILGPMAMGRRSLMLHAGFTPALTVAVMQKFEVTNFAAAPTVYRSLSKDPSVGGITLRRASSAGEPLTPDVLVWSETALGVPVRDHYGQTEHGMVIVNAWHDAVREPLIPGSMGKPLPGFTAGVVEDQIGFEVAGSPLMWFTGYVDAPDKTAERFTDDGSWYLTGDAGRIENGSYFFSARNDDVIIMAGYRIGPFDVESVLVEHPSVMDVAVVGQPDDIRGEVIEAYVVLAEGVSGTAELESELQQLVKSNFAAHAYPRTVHFVDALPKTPSGKVQRFLLRRSRQPGSSARNSGQ
ncbi:MULTISPECIES: AMP-binding protein [unclassified Rhodococcus (in: high G+C Gram-positive bacteria)]|uniref:AMP-binding protein n=1 Tax=unclassified Rhodococcus (in: high G+C Gram-positive bacteria) TaxID=192944 RepID=UPI00068E129B|nr:MULTISPECIES: AMP-binding protein [unclassified Rhodococcus (in: high G+C Gram-positive bacteria)]KQU30299.1 AMP-dependent synthetase [Rhodococcus sp. Leaf225]KQU44796.1 AMP-dependent synthetase [Rhodococcus sp. Leaf258]